MTTKAEKVSLLESRPHFSLTMMAAIYVFLLISLVVLLIGLFFAKVGAWPVLIYTLLVLMGLRLGFQHAWMRSGDYERLWFEDDDLLVEICELGITKQHRFNRYWASIQESPSFFGHCTHLIISAHGKQACLGRHMGGEQRLRFARQLKQNLKSQD